jgi:hypothetical protein
MGFIGSALSGVGSVLSGVMGIASMFGDNDQQPMYAQPQQITAALAEQEKAPAPPAAAATAQGVEQSKTANKATKEDPLLAKLMRGGSLGSLKISREVGIGGSSGASGLGV